MALGVHAGSGEDSGSRAHKAKRGPPRACPTPSQRGNPSSHKAAPTSLRKGLLPSGAAVPS